MNQVGPGVPFTVDALALAHGAAVVGVVAAVDNRTGVIGIAPGARIGTAPTGVAGGTRGEEDAVAAVWGAIAHPGPQPDVILLQVTCSQFPLELQEGVAAVIQAATALGVTVVEAAGNAGQDLAQFPQLDPTHAGFIDSCAILVGSSLPTGSAHARNPTSNFGRRVDCFAWGKGVVTAGDYPNTGTGSATYTSKFSGTSAASAIVAGAALLLRSIRAVRDPASPLQPVEVRTLLSAPAHGLDRRNEGIGVMPDLAVIAPLL